MDQVTLRGPVEATTTVVLMTQNPRFRQLFLTAVRRPHRKTRMWELNDDSCEQTWYGRSQPSGMRKGDSQRRVHWARRVGVFRRHANCRHNTPLSIKPAGTPCFSRVTPSFRGASNEYEDSWPACMVRQCDTLRCVVRRHPAKHGRRTADHRLTDNTAWRNLRLHRAQIEGIRTRSRWMISVIVVFVD